MTRIVTEKAQRQVENLALHQIEEGLRAGHGRAAAAYGIVSASVCLVIVATVASMRASPTLRRVF